MDYRELAATCELALRRGHASTVAQRIGALPVKEIPREWRLPFANLCRRAGLYALAQKILMPAVFAFKAEWSADASPGELGEYAVVLERSGAVHEALKVLARVNPESLPEARLYRSFCHFKFWNYGAAIPELQAYIQSNITPYSKLVGQVNLAAAFVAEFDYESAQDLLTRLVEYSGQENFSRLRGNCFELRAQTFLHQGRISEAAKDLKRAAAIFAREKTIDRFFVDKWSVILGAVKTGHAEPLHQLRRKAGERRDWESVREADLFLCKVRFEAALFHHLYYGTPHEHYRRRVTRMLEREPTADYFDFGSGDGPCLDLATGEFSGLPLRPGKNQHRVLEAVLRDRYRPVRIAEMFGRLFPDEHYNPYSSPTRVHQNIQRLRRWIGEHKVSLAIQFDSGNMFAAIEGPLRVRIGSESGVNGWEAHWARAYPALRKEQEFTSEQVRQVLDLKKTACKRFLRWALESGKIDRVGSNNSTHYLIKNKAS